MPPPEIMCPLKACVLRALCPQNLVCVMEEQEGACSPYKRDEGSWRWGKEKGQQGQRVWNSPLTNWSPRLGLWLYHVWHCQQEGRNQKPGQPFPHWDHSTTGRNKGLWSGHIPDGRCRAGQHCRGMTKDLCSWRGEDGGRKLAGGSGEMLQAPRSTPNGGCADLVPAKRQSRQYPQLLTISKGDGINNAIGVQERLQSNGSG